MSDPRGASVVIVGGGATGLSAAWWLAREGVDVLVIDKGLVAWEASGRNGGGCTHPFSPLFKEEQRLWPLMDELLGYPTEFRPQRIRIAMDDAQMRRYGEARQHAVRQGFVSDRLDRATGARAGATGWRQYCRRLPASFRWPCQSAAHGAGLRVGDAGPWRAAVATHHGRGVRHRRRQGHARFEPIAARSAATCWCSPRGRRSTTSPPRSACMCRWWRRGPK